MDNVNTICDINNLKNTKISKNKHDRLIKDIKHF